MSSHSFSEPWTFRRSLQCSLTLWDVVWLQNSLNYSLKDNVHVYYMSETFLGSFHVIPVDLLHSALTASGTLTLKSTLREALMFPWPESSRSGYVWYVYHGSWKKFINICYRWPHSWSQFSCLKYRETQIVYDYQGIIVS